MATIKLAVLRHTKAKDGSYKIRISIGHKSETHYIVTKYKVTSLSNFVNGVVVSQPDAKAINIKLRQLLNEYDERLERIPNAGDMSCEELRNTLRDMTSNGSNMTLGGVAEMYLSNLSKEGRNTTVRLMNYHIRRFLEYTNGDIFLTHITPKVIDDYVHQLKQKGISPAYTHMSVAPVRTLLNYAIKMQLVKYDIHPFTYYQRPQAAPKEVDISIEDMRKIFAYRGSTARMRIADLFKLSYILGGMNLKDITSYDFRKADTLSYIRTKIKNRNVIKRPVVFTIQPEGKEIISKYVSSKTGMLDIMENSKYESFLSRVNATLKKIAKEVGVSDRLCFYSARKSFVQHGFDLGIPLEVLEYCIGQTMKTNRPIFNYAKVMTKHADDAIRKILDAVNKCPLPSQATDSE